MINNGNTPDLKILLVDDNPDDLRTISLLLGRLPFVRILAKETSSLAAYDFAIKNKVDVLISDMVMDDLDGINLMDALGDGVEVIFISAQEVQAARAYSNKVKYWFHKPVSFIRIKEALEEIYARSIPLLYELKQNFMTINVQKLDDERLGIKRKWYMRFHLDDIAAFASLDNYVELIKTDGSVYTFRGTLTDLESTLPQDRFRRVHKSYMVNIYNCERFSLQSKSNLVHVRGYDTAIPLNESGVLLMKGIFELSNDLDLYTDEDTASDPGGM